MNSRRFLIASMTALLAGAISACSPSPEDAEPGRLGLELETYTLGNGLDVILHLDRSDPIAAVAVTYHVGSARELPGRTGFAHLFEHLMFLDSEHLGPGGFDRLMDRIGGTLNGFTNRDRTNYYALVPNDGLEKALWAEADRMGFFIGTVTGPVVEREKQIVKNERRQSYDNQPYGHTYEVVSKSLYPESHPYSWPVIGSLEDVDAATLGDVREFYRSWYGPNNATLVVAGDFDRAQVREWIDRYFGEIPARPAPDTPTPRAPELGESLRIGHEDRLASLPELTLTWPTVPLFHPDSYALRALMDLLYATKTSPLYEVIVEESRLAPEVGMYEYASDLAGELTLTVRAFEGTDLDDVLEALDRAFGRFESEGFTEADLERVVTGQETAFYAGYNGISSLLGKAFQFAEYHISAGDAGYIEQDLGRILSVTREDVLSVYERYIRNRPYVATSFVPQGEARLMLEGSEPARIVDETFVDGGGEAAAPEDESFPALPPDLAIASSFDRSLEPPFGPAPSVPVPDVWERRLPNGVGVYGIRHGELPLVRFTVRFRAGQLAEPSERPGVASLTAALLMEGTRTKTPEDLEEALDTLGATITVSSGRETLTLTGTTLARNYPETVALVGEMLTEPRWDEIEFERLRSEARSALTGQRSDPSAIARNTFNRLLYGEAHVLSRDPLGTLASLEAMRVADLIGYYESHLVPANAAIHVVGDIDPDAAVAALAGLEQAWGAMGEAPPEAALSAPSGAAPGLYFVDLPGATQSVIVAGSLGMSTSDPDFYPATIMNVRLGGTFTSRLNQTLREERGYTYGASSGFAGGRTPGPFTLSTSVRSDVTMESLALIRDILTGYADGFQTSDMETTRGYLLRSNARAFETPNSKIGMLHDISFYGFRPDYVREREGIVRDMTAEEVRRLARHLVDPARMIFLVVGDARTEITRLGDLGMGDPVFVE